MEHHAQVTYDEAMIHEAAWHFAVRSIGWRGLLAFALILLALAYLIGSGDESWLVGALGVIAVLTAAMGVALYIVPRGRSLARLRDMPSQSAELIFGDSGITVTSEIARQEFPWRLIERIWTYPRFWMVFLRGANYMIIPMSTVDEAARAFIVDRVKQNGGHVSFKES